MTGVQTCALPIVVDPQGNSRSLAAVFIGVMVISFAATSLDTAVRIQRYIIGEIGEAIKVKTLAENRYLQSAIAVLFSLALVLSDGTGAGGLKLWPLFGSTNQLLSSLTLLVISLWLYQQGRQYWYTLIPMLFITVITFIATYFNMLMYLNGDNYLLVAIALVVGVAQLWIIFEGIKTFREKRIQIKD